MGLVVSRSSMAWWLAANRIAATMFGLPNFLNFFPKIDQNIPQKACFLKKTWISTGHSLHHLKSFTHIFAWSFPPCFFSGNRSYHQHRPPWTKIQVESCWSNMGTSRVHGILRFCRMCYPLVSPNIAGCCFSPFLIGNTEIHRLNLGPPFSSHVRWYRSFS